MGELLWKMTLKTQLILKCYLYLLSEANRESSGTIGSGGEGGGRGGGRGPIIDEVD